MVEERIRVEAAGFGNIVGRVGVVLKEKHPRTEEERHAIIQVKRPWWSKQEPEMWSLTGGRVRDVDLDESEPTEADIEHITARTAQRRLRQELGIQVSLEQLHYIGLFDNGEWVTALFYCFFEEEPTVIVAKQPDPLDKIDGYQWVEIHQAAENEKTSFDHGMMIQAVIDVLGSQSE